MFYAVYKIRKTRLATKWPKIPARVVRSRVIKFIEPVEANHVTYFQPEILFEYQYQGQTLRSVDLCLDAGSYRFTKFNHASAVLEQFPDNKSIEISCSDKGRVVLFQDIDASRKQHYFAWFVTGVLVAALTSFMLWNLS